MHEKLPAGLPKNAKIGSCFAGTLPTCCLCGGVLAWASFGIFNKFTFGFKVLVCGVWTFFFPLCLDADVFFDACFLLGSLFSMASRLSFNHPLITACGGRLAKSFSTPSHPGSLSKLGFLVPQVSCARLRWEIGSRGNIQHVSKWALKSLASSTDMDFLNFNLWIMLESREIMSRITLRSSNLSAMAIASCTEGTWGTVSATKSSMRDATRSTEIPFFWRIWRDAAKPTAMPKHSGYRHEMVVYSFEVCHLSTDRRKKLVSKNLQANSLEVGRYKTTSPQQVFLTCNLEHLGSTREDKHKTVDFSHPWNLPLCFVNFMDSTMRLGLISKAILIWILRRWWRPSHRPTNSSPFCEREPKVPKVTRIMIHPAMTSFRSPTPTSNCPGAVPAQVEGQAKWQGVTTPGLRTRPLRLPWPLTNTMEHRWEPEHKAQLKLP